MYNKSKRIKRLKKHNHKKTLKYKGGVHTTHNKDVKHLTETQSKYLVLLRTFDNAVKQINDKFIELEKDIF